MFHFLEYPFSRGSTHIKSADPYETPDFDCGFMNDERDMAPMVWGYIKSRETARRMDAYAGEVETMVSRWTFLSSINPVLPLISPPLSSYLHTTCNSIPSSITTLPLEPTTWTSPQPRRMPYQAT